MVGTKWHEIKDLENLETDLWFYDGRLIEQINGGKAQRNGALANWGEELVRNYVKNMSDVECRYERPILVFVWSTIKYQSNVIQVKESIYCKKTAQIILSALAKIQEGNR